MEGDVFQCSIQQYFVYYDKKQRKAANFHTWEDGANKCQIIAD